MLHSENRFAMTITAGLTRPVGKEEIIILEYNLVILVSDGLGVNSIIQAGKLVNTGKNMQHYRTAYRVQHTRVSKCK
jgi:hypothetical protein